MADPPEADEVGRRAESLLDRAMQLVRETLEELRRQGRENGPGIEDQLEPTDRDPGVDSEQ